MRLVFLAFVFGLTLLVCAPGVHAQLPSAGSLMAPIDPRYCGEPPRYANGKIKRSSKVRNDFANVFPCPATLQPTTVCPGWSIDHTIPLASGGCDTVANMSWLNNEIKTCPGKACKDRWERKYHGLPRQPVTLP